MSTSSRTVMDPNPNQRALASAADSPARSVSCRASTSVYGRRAEIRKRPRPSRGTGPGHTLPSPESNWRLKSQSGCFWVLSVS